MGGGGRGLTTRQQAEQLLTTHLPAGDWLQWLSRDRLRDDLLAALDAARAEGARAEREACLAQARAWVRGTILLILAEGGAVTLSERFLLDHDPDRYELVVTEDPASLSRRYAARPIGEAGR